MITAILSGIFTAAFGYGMYKMRYHRGHLQGVREGASLYSVLSPASKKERVRWS